MEGRLDVVRPRRPGRRGLGRRPYLDYATALANGWQIATGIIEGATRFLIKDRMDITGARWSTPGAQAVLRLRAVIANGDFDEYWQWHQQQELRRNHLDRYQNSILQLNPHITAEEPDPSACRWQVGDRARRPSTGPQVMLAFLHGS